MAQTQQRTVATELRIDAAIIFGIVFMHAGGDEYRVQIERGYAKLLEIRQFLADPIEVAAKNVDPPASPVNGSSHDFRTISRPAA